MSRSSTLFAGLFGSFAVSCFAMILLPQSQLGGVHLQQQFTEEDGKYTDLYPVENASVEKGRAIYASEGCIYCHSQQVRDPQNGTDLERGWGARRTVARDYIFEKPPFLGTQRIGPDLANAGSPDWRNEPKGDTEGRPQKRDAAWHYLHLYAPRVLHSSSNQPAYRYLFEKRKISGQGSADALHLTGEDAPNADEEIVPGPDAKSLVKYLLSLDRSHPLKEASAAPPGTPEAPAASAAPAPPAAPAAPAAK